MIHPATRVVRVDDEIGYGVIATEPIPRGTIVWVRDRADVVLSPEEMSRLSPLAQVTATRYGYRDRWGATIVCADAGRLVNHSCMPVVRGVGHDAQIAVRDLHAGDEITCDYAECNLEAPMRCACGHPRCRGEVRPDDLLRHADAWEAEVAEALLGALGLEQAIVAFAVDPSTLRNILDGRLPPVPLREVSYLRC